MWSRTFIAVVELAERVGLVSVSCFYKSQQEHMIPLVERKSGVQFQRIGAPQPVDIVMAGAKDSIK